MLIWRYLLMSSGFGMILTAAGILVCDFHTRTLSGKKSSLTEGVMPQLPKNHWRISVALALLAWGPILLAMSLVLVPMGIAAAHVR